MPKVTLSEARVRALRPGKTVRDIPAVRSANPGILVTSSPNYLKLLLKTISQSIWYDSRTYFVIILN